MSLTHTLSLIHIGLEPAYCTYLLSLIEPHNIYFFFFIKIDQDVIEKISFLFFLYTPITPIKTIFRKYAFGEITFISIVTSIVNQ